jgi:ribose transport system ATP-binding protein|tara:strand:+ start:1979 stop:3517 length:1539 start_codon:yes stop_codon:yes gene_type:complete
MSSQSRNFSLLELNGLSKSFGKVDVLKDISLSLESGSIHALLGENGAGKSTLIKILSGVEKPNLLKCKVRGEEIELEHARNQNVIGIRFIHQELQIIPHLSVAENILLGHHIPRKAGIFVDWRKAYSIAQESMDSLGITDINAKEKLSRLNVGDRMLVKLCGAFVSLPGIKEADLYVLDEPTASLNGTETDRLFKVLKKLKEHGKSILYVSHRLDEIFNLADKVSVLRDGEIVLKCDLEGLSSAHLTEAMTGRILDKSLPKRRTKIEIDKVLDVKDLSNERLKAISFSAQKGEILGLAGLIGSGRTELLRALIGADKLFSGEIQLSGKSIKPITTNMWQKKVSYIPEERRTQGLVMNQSVLFNTALSFFKKEAIYKIFFHLKLLLQKTTRVVKQVNLKATGVDQPIWQLSGGNQQKVMFARALWNQPDLLLLDEPTRGVDVGAKQEIYQIIREASETGTTIIMASSEWTEMISLCDRILVLSDGKIIESVETDGMTEAILLKRCYQPTTKAT